MAGRRPVSQPLLDHSVTPHSLTVSGLGKIPSLTAEVNYILWDKASSPHCTDGVAEDPRGGELQAAMSQRGSWEAARPCLLSLEATACISSSHWCLGKRGQQAAGCHREDPSCVFRPATAPCCLTGPRAHPLHVELAFQSLEWVHVP